MHESIVYVHEMPPVRFIPDEHLPIAPERLLLELLTAYKFRHPGNVSHNLGFVVMLELLEYDIAEIDATRATMPKADVAHLDSVLENLDNTVPEDRLLFEQAMYVLTCAMLALWDFAQLTEDQEYHFGDPIIKNIPMVEFLQLARGLRFNLNESGTAQTNGLDLLLELLDKGEYEFASPHAKALLLDKLREHTNSGMEQHAADRRLPAGQPPMPLPDPDAIAAAQRASNHGATALTHDVATDVTT